MAIDTRSKRASILGIGLVAALTLPFVDGTVGQPDRQHVAYTYPGISTEETGQEPSPIVVLCAPDDVVVAVLSDDQAPDVELEDVVVAVQADDLVVLVGPDDQGIES